jgi:hypothetical protein
MQLRTNYAIRYKYMKVYCFYRSFAREAVTCKKNTAENCKKRAEEKRVVKRKRGKAPAQRILRLAAPKGVQRAALQ